MGKGGAQTMPEFMQLFNLVALSIRQRGQITTVRSLKRRRRWRGSRRGEPQGRGGGDLPAAAPIQDGVHGVSDSVQRSRTLAERPAL